MRKGFRRELCFSGHSPCLCCQMKRRQRCAEKAPSEQSGEHALGDYRISVDA